MLSESTFETVLAALDFKEEQLEQIGRVYIVDNHEAIKAAIAAARAEIEQGQQQGGWMPVEDGYHYISVSNDRIDVGYPKVLKGKSVLVVGQDGDNQNMEPIVLPQDIRLCRWQPLPTEPAPVAQPEPLVMPPDEWGVIAIWPLGKVGGWLEAHIEVTPRRKDYRTGDLLEEPGIRFDSDAVDSKFARAWAMGILKACDIADKRRPTSAGGE